MNIFGKERRDAALAHASQNTSSPEGAKESSELPPGWSEQRVEQIFAPLADGRTLHQGWSPQCDKVPSPSDDVWGVLKTTAIQAGEFQPEHNKLLPSGLEPRPMIEVKEGDILLTCAGPRVRCGVSCLVRQTRKRLMMSGKMYRFRVDVDRADARYVEAFLQTERARQAIDKMKTGSSDSGLNLTHERFRQLLVPIAPLSEQRRIVAEIEKQFTRLESGVTALRRVQANLKRYRAAVLKAACEGRLVPGVLSNWTQTTIEDVCSKVTDGDHQPPPKVSAGIPFLTIGNISSGRLDFSDTRFVPAEYFARIKSDRIPQSNDVLYSVVGATIGIPVLVNTERQFCFQRHIALLKPSSAILSRFLWLFMASPQTFREAWAKTTGSAQPTLPLKAVRALPIALPPLAEQTRIVAEVERRLSVVEELEAAVSANRQRATRLRQSILQKAFTGQLFGSEKR